MVMLAELTTSEGDDGLSRVRRRVSEAPAAGGAEVKTSLLPNRQKQTSAQRSSRRRGGHSPEAWEAVKKDIAVLYLAENMRLKDVMALMEERYGFYATSKMYKTKFSQWKFYKNNRQEDVASLLHIQRKRLTMGKDTTFCRNGRAVDITAYIRRKGLQPADLIEAAHSSDLPPTLRCGTPPTPRLPRGVDAPDDYLFQESYWNWSTQSGMLPARRNPSYLKSLDHHRAGEAMRSVILITHGSWLFSIGRVQDGGSFCRQAFETINLVLDDSAHLTIYELLAGIVRYPDQGIYQKLWGYLSEYAVVKRDVNHRLQRMVAAFAKMSQEHSVDHNVDMAQWGRRCASEHSGNGTFDGNSFDYSLIEPWDVLPMDRSYRHRYFMSQERWVIDEIPSATMPDLDTGEEPWNIRADLLLMLGKQTGWADARISTLALKMLDQISTETEAQQQYMHFVCLYALARNSRARCSRDVGASWNPDHKLAREYLRRAAEIQKRAWPPGKNYYETLSLLGRWQREAGDAEEAEATYRKREVECQRAFEVLLL